MNTKSVSLVFPNEGFTIGIDVRPEGDGLYRLRNHPLFTESAKYGDLIRCKDLGNDHLEFLEVVESSKLEVIDGIFTAEQLNSAAVQAVLAKVMSTGGYWQIDMVGFLTVLFDPEVYDPRHDLKKAVA